MNKKQFIVLIIATILFIPLCLFAAELAIAYEEVHGLSLYVFASFFLLVGGWIYAYHSSK
jgi:amino acid transporter